MGRDGRYKKEYVQKVDEYLEKRQDEETEVIKATGKNDYAAYEQKLKVKLPTIEGFADYIGVSRKSLYNWEKTHTDFAFALEKIKNEQQQRLIDRGLEGSYNPTIAKLILSANHNMREKSDITSDDEPLNTFTDDQIDRIAQRVARRKAGAGNTSSKR